MGHLDKAVDIGDLGQSSLWVLYGKSGSGKTELLSTFPTPMLYIQIGDDGSNTIADKEGIKALVAETVGQLKEILLECRLNKTYKTIAVDTFSLLVNEWMDENAVKKKKRVTQQMWGDLKTDTEEVIKIAKILAKTKNVILTCHEVADSFEGMEDEISPDVRPSLSKGARTYLESMANYGIHTAVLLKDKEQPDGTTKQVAAHLVHLASNPYYWVKTQKPAHIKLPKTAYNPSYDKIMRLMRGER